MVGLQFLREFLLPDGIMSILAGGVDRAKYYKTVPEDLPEQQDVYFGVAARKSKGNEKADVLGTRVLWVDADDLQKPLYTLPPSFIVMSGHGYHMYWVLNEPSYDIPSIEFSNQLLAKDIPTGDTSCWNCNRILRVPGTLNTKAEPVRVTLDKFRPDLKYNIEDFRILEKLSKKTRHKIRTGDRRGHRSRSERDWSVIVDLIAAGASDELILKIFAEQPIGDKLHEEGTTEHYLERTLSKARQSNAVAVKKKEESAGTGLEEGPDGFYMGGRRGSRRVSTFILKPKLLLDGTSYDAEDALVTDVLAEGFTWPSVTFTRSAFTSVQKMDRETPVAAWQWLGSDGDVRQLLPYLISRLQEEGLPRVIASPYVGLHLQKDEAYYVGTDGTLSAKQYWTDFSGPMAWLPSQKEHPSTSLQPQITQAELDVLADLLPKINEPQALWPMLGWYAASVFKPWIEKHNLRFPVLNVVGTKGSGKTTLIQKVFMPLLGQPEPVSYDASTTRFVILAILGSSNAMPMAFSEFRYESAEKFLRYVLLSYDTGHDPRGRGDQTTVDYPLMAPFSIDGEDLIADPAARERIVVAMLHPDVVAEGSEAYIAFNNLRDKVPSGFAGYFLQQGLEWINDGHLNNILTQAKADIFLEFPQRLPDRVRNNHIVALFGCYVMCDVLGIERPKANDMRRSIETVFNVNSGRSRTMIDDLTEDVVNACSASTSGFKWEYDLEQRALYFQFTPAHSWWLASRKRQGRTGLEKDALRAQLQEAPYSLPAKTFYGAYMMGIDLAKAQAAGLDVPDQIITKEFRMRF